MNETPPVGAVHLEDGEVYVTWLALSIHLLHALAGCELATATYVARRMRLKIGGIRFELEAHRESPDPQRSGSTQLVACPIQSASSRPPTGPRECLVDPRPGHRR